MNLLLETHIFLWYLSADSRLHPSFRTAIQDPANLAFLSVASIWEVAIKHALGKIDLPSPPAEYLTRQRQSHRIHSLSIDENAIMQLAHLPLLHRDPFDRIIVAQAIREDMLLVTMDSTLSAYPVKTLSPSE